MEGRESNLDWFWQNYKKGMEWVHKHDSAYWKSRAMALAVENEKLLKIIHDHHMRNPRRKVKSTRTAASKKHRNKKTAKRKRRKSRKSSNGSVEVSEELIQFFKVSIKHKEELNKKKKEEEARQCEFTPPQEELDNRIRHMKELYGEGYSKIMGMETSVRLSYERYVDHKAPCYWPELPLKL